MQGSSFERPVATAAVRLDPVTPGTGYLTMLQFVNDRTTLHVLLESLAEALAPLGVRTLIGPTHLLPHLGGGALSSHWQLPPPPDTLYGPPYLPEHLDALMSPLDTSVLYDFEPAAELRGAEVRLEPFSLNRLAQDLLPLLQTATAASPALSPPDAAEAGLILQWLESYRPTGFLATLQDQPAGFALLYPPTSHRRFRRAPSSGARLWGGVLPAFQRQGVGGALLGAGLKVARENLSEHVSVGPVSQQGDAAAFLRACGGVEAQRYTLYRTDLQYRT